MGHPRRHSGAGHTSLSRPGSNPRGRPGADPGTCARRPCPPFAGGVPVCRLSATGRVTAPLMISVAKPVSGPARPWSAAPVRPVGAGAGGGQHPTDHQDQQWKPSAAHDSWASTVVNTDMLCGSEQLGKLARRAAHPQNSADTPVDRISGSTTATPFRRDRASCTRARGQR